MGRAIIGQLWRGRAAIGQPVLKDRCPDYGDARLPGAGVQWGDGLSTLYSNPALLLENATAELCSVSLRERKF